MKRKSREDPGSSAILISIRCYKQLYSSRLRNHRLLSNNKRKILASKLKGRNRVLPHSSSMELLRELRALLMKVLRIHHPTVIAIVLKMGILTKKSLTRKTLRAFSSPKPLR